MNWQTPKVRWDLLPQIIPTNWFWLTAGQDGCNEFQEFMCRHRQAIDHLWYPTKQTKSKKANSWAGLQRWASFLNSGVFPWKKRRIHQNCPFSRQSPIFLWVLLDFPGKTALPERCLHLIPGIGVASLCGQHTRHISLVWSLGIIETALESKNAGNRPVFQRGRARQESNWATIAITLSLRDQLSTQIQHVHFKWGSHNPEAILASAKYTKRRQMPPQFATCHDNSDNLGKSQQIATLCSCDITCHKKQSTTGVWQLMTFAVLSPCPRPLLDFTGCGLNNCKVVLEFRSAALLNLHTLPRFGFGVNLKIRYKAKPGQPPSGVPELEASWVSRSRSLQLLSVTTWLPFTFPTTLFCDGWFYIFVCVLLIEKNLQTCRRITQECIILRCWCLMSIVAQHNYN